MQNLMGTLGRILKRGANGDLNFFRENICLRCSIDKRNSLQREKKLFVLNFKLDKMLKSVVG